MSTNISLNNKERIKTNVAIGCALLMLVGFLLSRAMLSLGTVLFGINALVGTNPKQWLKDKYWLLGMSWVAVYILSGLWSDNMGEWGERVSVKLPLLLLPLAFTLLPAFSKKQLQFFTVGAALLFLTSFGYSIYFLISNPAYYIEQYRFSKVLPTLAGHDYIRYSLSLSLFIIWCFCVWNKLSGKAVKWFVGLTIALLVVYVHIIAVKTGILVLYLFVLLWGLYIAISRRPLLGVGIIMLLVAMIVGAYKYVPTFTNKVDYFRYSFKVLQEGHYDSDYSDIGRLVSYDIALKQMPSYAAMGAGMGDVPAVMDDGYDKWYPKVPDVQRIKPHNQFLIVALGCGMLTLILFLVWTFYPLKWVKRNREGFFMFAMWLVMFVPLMTEPFLELQFGIYVYLFFLLWVAHSIKTGKVKAE